MTPSFLTKQSGTLPTGPSSHLKCKYYTDCFNCWDVLLLFPPSEGIICASDAKTKKRRSFIFFVTACVNHVKYVQYFTDRNFKQFQFAKSRPHCKSAHYIVLTGGHGHVFILPFRKVLPTNTPNIMIWSGENTSERFSSYKCCSKKYMAASFSLAFAVCTVENCLEQIFMNCTWIRQFGWKILEMKTV